MLFRVSQISATMELVFANSDDFINVYPAYHQKGSLVYTNVNREDWRSQASEYLWETMLPDINTETVPVIQLIYSYNATPSERQAQYAAFRSITAVETITGKLRIYANAIPSVSFRIRFRILNRFDIAPTIDRLFGVGVGCSATPEGVSVNLTALNPISNRTSVLTGAIPAGDNRLPGSMPAGVLSRIAKLEAVYNDSLDEPYRITGYSSDAATDAITTYYPSIASMQELPAGVWYQECEVWTRTNPEDFVTADYLFYEQRATRLDITHVYTGSVRSFRYALAENVRLQEIVGLDLLDTHQATDLSYMFTGDYMLTHIDLSSWDLSKVTNIEGMFRNCLALQELNLQNLDLTKVVAPGVRLIDQHNILAGVPNNCTIWVSGEEQRNALLSVYPDLTNVTYN